MNFNKIKSFKKILKDNINNINKKIIKRNRKINFNEILYESIFKSINGCSYDNVSYEINKNFINN